MSVRRWPAMACAAAAVALLVVALPSAAEDAAGVWQDATRTGLGRQEVSYVRVGGALYLAGGSTAHQKFVNGRWSSVRSLPRKLDHIQGVAVDGKIYYLGGLTSWPDGDVSSVYIYDPATDTFSTGASMGGRGRGAGGVAVHEGRIYYAGGLHDGVAVKWFDVYDPKANRWTTLPDMPTARDHFHAAVARGRFWAIGGRNKDIGATVAVNEAYRFAGGAWERGHAPLPTQRGGFAAALHGDEIVVIGGEGRNSSGTLTALATVEAYDTGDDTWRRLQPMPTARHGIQAATCNGGIYIAAGATRAGRAPTDVHEVLFPGGSPTACPAPAPPPPAPGPSPGPSPGPTVDPGTDPAPGAVASPGGPAGPGPAAGVRPQIVALSVAQTRRWLRVHVGVSRPAVVRLTVRRVRHGRLVPGRVRRHVGVAERRTVRMNTRRLSPGLHRLSAVVYDGGRTRVGVRRLWFRVGR